MVGPVRWLESGLATPFSTTFDPCVSKALEGALTKLTGARDGIITASLKQFTDAQEKPLKNAVPAIFGPENEGDPKKIFGDFPSGRSAGRPWLPRKTLRLPIQRLANQGRPW